MLRRWLSFPWIIPLGLALLVGGAKLALIHDHASDQPYLDQWSGEGGAVFQWRVNGHFSFSHYFFPHGEHTPALTRIITVGTTLFNSGQWDPRLAMVASVVAMVLAAMLLWQVVSGTVPGRWRLPAALGGALFLAAPANYENFLWGFQTQFIFLLLFGLTHLVGTLREEKIGASWWLAQIAGLLGLFSIAAGLLSAAVLAGIAALRLISNRRSSWAWATFAINLVLLALGAWLLFRAFFAAERTTGLSGAFFAALGPLLAWPLPSGWLALLTQLPAVAWLLGNRLRADTRERRWLLGLVLWTWALAAAFAYGRGASGGDIAVRYQDPLAVGVAVNLILAAVLLARTRSPLVRWVGAGWALALLAGFLYANRPGMLSGNLSWMRDYYERQGRALTAYLATNDVAELKKDELVHASLPHFEQARGVLADPLVRQSLPPSLVRSVPLSADPVRSTPAARFVLAPEPSPNSAGLLTLTGQGSGARFVSQPVTDDSFPVWRLRVAGRVGPGGAGLALERDDGARIALLGEEFDTGGAWKTVHFPRGRGPVRLVVTVPPGQTLRLTEPVELGWLSWLLPKLTGLGRWMLAFGGLLLVAAAFAPAQPASAERRD